MTNSPNGQALVRRASAEDLYFAIAEVGLSESVEIVQLAFCPLSFKPSWIWGAGRRIKST